jgi:REP element-mobilizing transposase RayT
MTARIHFLKLEAVERDNYADTGGGYFVSTVGLDEAMVRAYIRNQEAEDKRYDQMKFSL